MPIQVVKPLIGQCRSLGQTSLLAAMLLAGRCRAFIGSPQIFVRHPLSKIPRSTPPHVASVRQFSTLNSDGDMVPTFGPDEPNILGTHQDSLDTYSLRLMVPTPEDMEDRGAVLSIDTGGGDTILLGGDLGAGKTCLARGFVRARTGDTTMRVTSPTYLLCNTYSSLNGVSVNHMDLYRLSGDEKDLVPLDMDNVLTESTSLIEWPSRLGNMTPTERLDITFRIGKGEQEDEEIERILTLRAHGEKWEQRLKSLKEDGFVDDMLLEE